MIRTVAICAKGKTRTLAHVTVDRVTQGYDLPGGSLKLFLAGMLVAQVWTSDADLFDVQMTPFALLPVRIDEKQEAA